MSHTYQGHFGLFPCILFGFFCPMNTCCHLTCEGFAGGRGTPQAVCALNRAEGLAAALVGGPRNVPLKPCEISLNWEKQQNNPHRQLTERQKLEIVWSMCCWGPSSYLTYSYLSEMLWACFLSFIKQAKWSSIYACFRICNLCHLRACLCVILFYTAEYGAVHLRQLTTNFHWSVAEGENKIGICHKAEFHSI